MQSFFCNGLLVSDDVPQWPLLDLLFGSCDQIAHFLQKYDSFKLIGVGVQLGFSD